MDVIYLIIILLFSYFIITVNKFIKLNNRFKESFATMDVYLKKRWDLIPNYVEIVKGYTKHEQNTFKNITVLRNINYANLSNEEKINKNEQLSKNVTQFIAISEKYPELKANEEFINLSNTLVKLEDEIAQSRKYYNAVVREFNNKVQMFPSNIIAKLMGLKPQKMFYVEENERENIEVNL